jgi:hypothetical protein
LSQSGRKDSGSKMSTYYKGNADAIGGGISFKGYQRFADCTGKCLRKFPGDYFNENFKRALLGWGASKK